MPTFGANLRFLGVLVAGLIVGLCCGIPLLEDENAAGMIIIAVAPVLAIVAYGFRRRRSSPSRPPGAGEQRVVLAAVAFLGAPALALLVGVICITAFDVHPKDRDSTVVAVTTVGFIAGTIVGVALLASSAFD